MEFEKQKSVDCIAGAFFLHLSFFFFLFFSAAETPKAVSDNLLAFEGGVLVQCGGLFRR